MNDTLTGMFLGGFLALAIHYINILFMAWRMHRAQVDIAKMCVENATRSGDVLEK